MCGIFYVLISNFINMNEILLLLLSFKLIWSIEVDDNSNLGKNENSQLGVRAVVIQCDIPVVGFPSDSETVRFQREELFKHNALQDCKQKLAVTIKMSSNPSQAAGDEYIPIEHVLGVNRKRIRLLNPYVIRLRRKAPFELYKLKKIDTVRGVIANTFDIQAFGTNQSRRMQRYSSNPRVENWSANVGSGALFKLSHDDQSLPSYSVKIQDLEKPLRQTTTNIKVPSSKRHFDREQCSNKNDSLSNNFRDKRHNIKHSKDFDYARWTPTDFTSQKLQPVYDYTFNESPSRNIIQQPPGNIMFEEKEHVFDAMDKSNDVDNNIKYGESEPAEQKNSKSYDEKYSNKIAKVNKKEIQYYLQEHNNGKGEENDFTIYEVGDPDLWYSAQIQLYEKLSTPEGKTVWNDLTKDETAWVNSANPNWSNQDVDIQYKPAGFLVREDFLLSGTDLYLVAPIKRDHDTGSKDTVGEYMLVPADDVITLDEAKDIDKRDKNSDSNTTSRGVNHQRQVIVRTARALMGATADSLKIVSRGTDRYLKLPHPKVQYTQIDLEARADDNELILVGVLGRLTTIVSDTTRRRRSILTVQATNTGLAAARMRVSVRECRPELLDNNIAYDATPVGLVILPPRHTRTFRLKIPLPIPIQSANCTIALINADDQSVAVRDVRIKRDDRCFCVWHCGCVCLGEDPKLLCRDLSAAQLLAAGLSTQQKSRQARSVCYPDVATLNVFVTFIGCLIALLILGLLKALLGLVCRCVATWGLYRFLETPRKLDRYYERSLRNRRVVYDEEGWPVHPDTKERTVGLVSEPMEFILNFIFFVTLPCLMIWDAIRKLSHCKRMDGKCDSNYIMKEDVKRCFSSHDVQLQPLLQDESRIRKTCEQSSYIDSDQDDTEYVLMQMQKSRESLARSQRELEKKNAKMKGSTND